MDIIIRNFDDGHFCVGFSGGFDWKIVNAIRRVDGRIYNEKSRFVQSCTADENKKLQRAYNQ